MPRSLPRHRQEIIRSSNFKRQVALSNRTLHAEPMIRRWTKTATARLFDYGYSKDKITPSVIKYWTEKVNNPHFHPGNHGGRREGTFKLTKEESLLVQASLMAGLKRKPNRNLISAAAALTELVNTHLRPKTNAQRRASGTRALADTVKLTRRDIYGYLRSWGWTRKVPIRIHIHKFRPDNMRRYIQYATAITWIPPERLKFLDESTFASRGTRPHLSRSPLPRSSLITSYIREVLPGVLTPVSSLPPFLSVAPRFPFSLRSFPIVSPIELLITP